MGSRLHEWTNLAWEFALGIKEVNKVMDIIQTKIVKEKTPRSLTRLLVARSLR